MISPSKYCPVCWDFHKNLCGQSEFNYLNGDNLETYLDQEDDAEDVSVLAQRSI